MMKTYPEILAPAGSYDSVVAAVRSGADAVYMGMHHFNARIKADNFGEDEITEAIRYCHSHGVKVHITMNTVIFDSEIPEALEQIKALCSLGIDAVIVQDLGLAFLMKSCAPDLPLHASTQMSVQTAAGVNLLDTMGYSRVVLPREMSAQEIRSIKDKTSIETEAFVHGALCMCVSGQCYMSSMLGTRSGNRGLCAQPCRLPFSAQGGTGYDLSLKDLSLVEKLEEITNIGVDSLKIEGRMKRPEYVSTAVAAVRSGLSGDLDTDTLTKLRSVFSRSGFTDGYFTGNLGRDMFGTRQKEDGLAATSGLLKALASRYEKEVAVIPVSFCLNINEGEKVSLSASAAGKQVFVREDYIPEKAVSKPLTAEGLRDRLSKCGGTQFYADNIEIDLHEGLIVPASVINSLRRNALSELEKAIADVKPIAFTKTIPDIFPHKSRKSVKIHLRVANIGQIPDNLENVEYLIVPLKIDKKTAENLQNRGVNLLVELPRGIFSMENAVEALLEKVKAMGITHAYCGTFDGIALAKKHGFSVHTGFSMNVTNSLSVKVLEDLDVKSITLSPELTLKQCEKVGGKAERGIIAYGRLPLMLTRNCPIRNGKTCDTCKGNSCLTDRMSKRFPVICSYGCSEVLNSAPIFMADRLDEIHSMDFITLHFTKESKKQCEAILDGYRKGDRVKPESFTRGLYYRGTTDKPTNIK